MTSSNLKTSSGPTSKGEEVTAYNVLARKYRPQDFSSLIGQDALVQTLTNAFNSGRVAHAFILTGVRGVGKTSTARIIAKTLNCIGKKDDESGIVDPCNQCESCMAISEDRHIDVMEMDAASRTGVEDIRELIEGVRYKPVTSAYKVYIIDEVHMLSRSAFNALLKTLEEPPEHVKFVFATTEIRKVPVTVISRCQRFDLRRVDSTTLAKYFSIIAEKESAKISDSAIELISKVADGSVRDGQSLLDQVITANAIHDREISDKDVRETLGLIDRGRTIDILEMVFEGNIGSAIEVFLDDYSNGADPVLVMEDLLELVHWLTRGKITPIILDDTSYPEIERVRGRDLLSKITIAKLSRAWQMLLKGLVEAREAPSAKVAVEMTLIRLAHLGDLPTPAEVVKEISENRTSFLGSEETENGSDGKLKEGMISATEETAREDEEPEEKKKDQQISLKAPNTFDEVIELLGERNERILRTELINNVSLVNFAQGRIELFLCQGAESDIPRRLETFLRKNCINHWVVLSVPESGAKTLKQKEIESGDRMQKNAADHPLIKSIMKVFPGAEIQSVGSVLETDMESKSFTNKKGETTK